MAASSRHRTGERSEFGDDEVDHDGRRGRATLLLGGIGEVGRGGRLEWQGVDGAGPDGFIGRVFKTIGARVDRDAEVILFSPQKEHTDVIDHMIAAGGAMAPVMRSSTR
jgi:hypothetical protein